MVDPSSAAGLIPVGTHVEFAKTVSESDIYLFAGITGDFSPNHVNAEYMKSTPYGDNHRPWRADRGAHVDVLHARAGPRIFRPSRRLVRL